MAYRWRTPWVSKDAQKNRAPFRVLISTILSSRTKDEVTAEASRRLFAQASTPQEMLSLSEKKIARIIYPVGFYNTKARLIRAVCRRLIDKYKGDVPSEMTELLSLPGVGRKTANLVLTLGFKKPGICVDTHVHRISNRWGIVRTKTPAETEQALRHVLPKRHWIEINSLMVAFGQNICTPISPHCSQCGLHKYCPKIGVKRHR
ncbi:endonuclease III [Candidatus Sumerlaeota bacterium]|nr:endonuclease III [Candidatus Sumerlaeota bacterium]